MGEGRIVLTERQKLIELAKTVAYKAFLAGIDVATYTPDITDEQIEVLWEATEVKQKLDRICTECGDLGCRCRICLKEYCECKACGCDPNVTYLPPPGE